MYVYASSCQRRRRRRLRGPFWHLLSSAFALWLRLRLALGCLFRTSSLCGVTSAFHSLPFFRCSVFLCQEFPCASAFPLVSLRSIFAIFSPFLPSSTVSCTDFAPLSLASSISVIANFDWVWELPKNTVITFPTKKVKG